MLFINLDWKEKAQGDISIWKRARDIDIDASSDDTLNGSSASVWPAGGSWKNFQNKTFFVLAWLGFAVNREHLYAKALCSVRKKGGEKLEPLPPFLMTPDKYPVFLRCVSCSPQHRAETTWHGTQRAWWIGSHAVAPTPFALYFMKWTSGSEINRPLRWMRTTPLGPYQVPAANLWQAKPAPSLDTPLVFEIKVDACNPGKWSLYSRLTPV